MTRCTDRRRFTSWPVPVSRLERLATVAEEAGHGRATAIGDLADRFRVELLISRSLRTQQADPAVAAELESWVDRADPAGVLSSTIPDRPAPDPSHASRFGLGSLEDAGREGDGTDGLVVIGSERDDPEAWLRSGEGLSALWLRAVQDGLSVVPVSQVVEVPETRSALAHDILRGAFLPHLVVRVGWQPIGRSELPTTPRRPLEEVLLP
jgi:hypothetical protein